MIHNKNKPSPRTTWSMTPPHAAEDSCPKIPSTLQLRDESPPPSFTISGFRLVPFLISSLLCTVRERTPRSGIADSPFSCSPLWRLLFFFRLGNNELEWRSSPPWLLTYAGSQHILLITQLPNSLPPFPARQNQSPPPRTRCLCMGLAHCISVSFLAPFLTIVFAPGELACPFPPQRTSNSPPYGLFGKMIRSTLSFELFSFPFSRLRRSPPSPVPLAVFPSHTFESIYILFGRAFPNHEKVPRRFLQNILRTHLVLLRTPPPPCFLFPRIPKTPPPNVCGSLPSSGENFSLVVILMNPYPQSTICFCILGSLGLQTTPLSTVFFWKAFFPVPSLLLKSGTARRLLETLATLREGSLFKPWGNVAKSPWFQLTFGLTLSLCP